MWLIYADDQQNHIKKIIEHPEKQLFFDKHQSFRDRHEPGTLQVIEQILTDLHASQQPSASPGRAEGE